ncbi:MAG: uL30 family ribosomal protein [Nanoarchaeota archaeon]
MTTKQLAVIRIRGEVNLSEPIKRTFQGLHLYRKHYCTVVPAVPSMIGMIHKLKDYITWGEIDDTTYNNLIKKRGDGKSKPYFRLAPPTKGFERKGIKKSYDAGGALGYRGEAINALIERMI